jgi:hypothetical protein
VRKALSRAFIAVLLALAVSLSVSPENSLLAGGSRPDETTSAIQEFPAKKPRYDYMSMFYSRNTKPLGLKEDLALKKLMSQPGIKWAIRTGVGHILD